LQGEQVVIIGGEPDTVRARAIERALGVKVIWVPLREHGPATAARAPIISPSTSLVLIFRRLAGHLHIEQVAAWAVEADKPCVRHVGGLHPSAIARSIVNQAGLRLAARCAGGAA
jgi:hypothetical protein